MHLNYLVVFKNTGKYLEIEQTLKIIMPLLRMSVTNLDVTVIKAAVPIKNHCHYAQWVIT